MKWKLPCIVIGVWLFFGCASYSALRPADNLKANEFELSGGVTANSLYQVLPVGQINYGVTDWLELGLQYEVNSALAWARFGILNTEEHNMALALGIGGGKATLIVVISIVNCSTL